MIVYVDLLFLINFWFDFILLMSVSITLKRNVSLRNIGRGALVGSLSMITLVIPFTSFTLFLFKLGLAILMVITTFSFKDKKYLIQNLSYFYMTSTILGGFIYFWQLSCNEESYGLVFGYRDFSFSLPIILLSPVILFMYIKQRKEIRHYQQIIPVTFYFKNGQNIQLNGFLDTGNKLVDPITKKKIILVNVKKLKGIVPIRSPMYVAYNSLNHHGLLKCILIDKVQFMGIESHNYLIGLSEGDLLKDGMECVLNSYCLEEMK